jgi:hypothetical protein
MTATGYLAQYFGERLIDIEHQAGTNFSVVSTLGAHNLVDGTPVLIQYVEGISNVNGLVFKMKGIGPSTFTIPLIPVGSYIRGGTYFDANMANHYIPEL